MMTEKEKVVKEEKELNLAEKLGVIQSDLKAPKGQFNSFGKYKYRSCEDILEAVKPLLKKYRVVLTIADDIVLIGERYYIKATVTINDSSGNFKVSAYARESLDKKGMDDSQITGAASSYARKYALNGLLLIDDTKDADTQDNAPSQPAQGTKQTHSKPTPVKQGPDGGDGKLIADGNALLAAMTGGDTQKAIELVRKHSGFEGTEGRVERSSLEQLKGNWLFKTFKNIESEYQEFVRANADELSIDPAQDMGNEPF